MSDCIGNWNVAKVGLFNDEFRHPGMNSPIEISKSNAPWYRQVILILN